MKKSELRQIIREEILNIRNKNVHEAYGTGRFKDNVDSLESAKRFLKKRHNIKDTITHLKKGDAVWLYNGKKKLGIYKPTEKRLTFESVEPKQTLT